LALWSLEDFNVATMNVSLPDPMKDWVEAQARSGRYSNASDYVRDLIRRDQERAAKHDELQRLISEGIDSGISPRSMGDILKAARQQAPGAAQKHDL
jgi:antitoxin ParD1/3/4